MSLRVIPRLDIKSGNLVKGVQFEGLRVIGRPELFARYYYEQGADELLYMDIVASLYGRNSLLETISAMAKEIFIPLTVGGGIRSLEDIQKALRAGADKVAINTAALKNPDLIAQAAHRFGSSTIVVSIEAKRMADGSYEAYTDNGRERTNRNAVTWAVEAARLGAGEIMITSVDREGTGRGFDLDLLENVTNRLDIPVIIAGGAGTCEHSVSAAREGLADAVCIASQFHYDALRTLESQSPASRAPSSYNSKNFGSVETASVKELKEILARNGISCRPLAGGER